MMKEPKKAGILSPAEIARAWKDPQFRASLSAEQLAALPPAPVAEDEMSDEDLDGVAGGTFTAACYQQRSTPTN